MLKFNFEKLAKNCPRYNALKNNLINSEKLKKSLYSTERIALQCFIKTCCKETGLSLKESILHFAEDENFEVDFDKVNERINSVPHLECKSSTCSNENCIFLIK